MRGKGLGAILGAYIGSLISLQVPAQPAASPASTASAPTAAAGHALLDRYCNDCHNVVDWAGGIAYDTLDFEHIPSDAATWEKVVRKLRTQAMPPAGKPRPDKAGYDSLATFLESRLDAAATAQPDPGRPAAVHRLNRVEYTNAIRDLLGIEVDAASLFPADEAGAGFDNDGNMLSTSALLLERYLIAARQISRTAVGDPTLRPSTTTYEAPVTGLQLDRESEDLPFGSRGGMAVKHSFPLDGEYSIRVRLQRTKGIEGPRIIGVGEPHELDVRVDGKRVKLFAIGGDKDLRPDQVEDSLEVRFPAVAGTRRVGVTFLDDALVPEGMQRPLQAAIQLRGWGPRDDSMRPTGVQSVSISGPFNVRVTPDSLKRNRVFVCRPVAAADEEACARRILAGLARHAYRRPVTAADIDGLITYYRSGHDGSNDVGQHTGQDGGRFREGVRSALQAMLVSPDFLFRTELDPPGAQGPYRIGQLELASRLSFFLWSSIPDEELLQLAAAGKLDQQPVLEQQVRRMLGDPRSKMLVDNFMGQWLGLRSLSTLQPDILAFPDFDDDLRAAFEKETDLLLRRMLAEDRSVVDMLDAKDAYVNERLARAYGIPNVYGGRFRHMTLADANRRGILGKGAILTLTSLPNRTSPVLRGQWVLTNIMGAPNPPPPPNVPAFPEKQDTDFTQLTVRQRLEGHRKNPACAGCHARMDPLGFAFDSFDAIGEWRKVESDPVFASPELPVVHTVIDSSGVLPDGTQVQGPAQLRQVLLREPQNFAYVVTEKLLTYALGRGLDYHDAPAVRKVVAEAARSDYRWSSVILGIVRSTPFQMRAPAQADAHPALKTAALAGSVAPARSTSTNSAATVN
jgi:mono/diheme cytochrome c family protein